MQTKPYPKSVFCAVHSLFGSDSVYIDSDEDGLFDQLDLTIHIDPEINQPDLWAAVLNLTTRISFELMVLENDYLRISDQPEKGKKQLVILAPGKTPPGCPEKQESAQIWSASKSLVYVFGSDREKLSDLVNQIAAGGMIKNVIDQQQTVADFKNTTKGSIPNLLDLSQSQLLYTPTTDNRRGVRFNGRFVLEGDRMSPNLGLGLFRLINALLLETTEVDLPLVFGESSGDYEGVSFLVRESDSKPARISLHQKLTGRGYDLLLEGPGEQLAGLLEKWAPITSSLKKEIGEDLREILAENLEILNESGFKGAWAHYLAGWSEENQSVPPVYSRDRQMITKAIEALEINMSVSVLEAVSIERSITWDAETNDLIDRINSLPEGGGKLTGEIFISKPLMVRQSVKKMLSDILSQKGYQPDLVVYNAYKPGLSWLLETIIPQARLLENITTVRITCQPFKEEGALEPKSRWLQELYPGVEILRDELKLTDDVIEVEWNCPLDSVYEISIHSGDGKVLYSASLNPRVHRISYLPSTETKETVHPSTGCVFLKTAEEVLLNCRIATDRERFWETLQTKWLPDLEAVMVERIQNENPENQIAFWELLEFDIKIEETEERLPIANERISPMEALQEDIYFVLLDFCIDFVNRHQLPASLQLGQILPRVSIAGECEKPSASMKAVPNPWTSFPNTDRAEASHGYHVECISHEDDVWQVIMETCCEDLDDRFLERLFRIARVWGHDIRLEQKRFHLSVPQIQTDKIENQVTSIQKTLPDDRPLTLEETASKIQYLGDQPGLKSYVIAESLQKRPIRVIEATSVTSDNIYSSVRLRSVKPTILFNGRHHANEVSATTATLELAEYLISASERKERLKECNILMLPLENADGAAMLEKLLPDSPWYMLHAARFNSLGAEFACDYFKEEPDFSEAAAKTSLWWKWLPELVVDQHGVPDHEWNQPFSGYLPKRFEQFWIPRTFAYVILPYLTTPEHPHYPFAQKVVKRLNEVMKGEEEILSLNREIAARYNRYARIPEPEIFPPSDGEPMLAVPNLPRLNNTNSAMRYPEITHSEIVIEVPDEVVTGHRFKLCVKANRIIQNTIIDLLPKTQGRFEVERISQGYRLAWKAYTRG